MTSSTDTNDTRRGSGRTARLLAEAISLVLGNKRVLFACHSLHMMRSLESKLTGALTIIAGEQFIERRFNEITTQSGGSVVFAVTGHARAIDSVVLGRKFTDILIDHAVQDDQRVHLLAICRITPAAALTTASIKEQGHVSRILSSR